MSFCLSQISQPLLMLCETVKKKINIDLNGKRIILSDGTEDLLF